jgi:hypothetical protein
MYILIILFFIPLCSTVGQAFPELLRYKYNNCMACHVSPSGGGLLTSYGRNLSNEVLSTWGSEKETGVLHGLLNEEALEKYLQLGGDVRAVQTHQESTTLKVGRFIKMQADLSVGLVKDSWALVLNFGQLLQDQWREYGTSYYAMLKPRDELSIRAGLFIPQYGLHIKDHFAYVRTSLGFGLGAERNSAEVQWTGTDWTTNMTLAKDVNSSLDPESTTTLQTQYSFMDRFKIAGNILKGQTSLQSRDIYGVWSVLGFTQNFFLVSELDQQIKNSSGTSTTGLITYNKLGYGLMKGLDAFVLHESLQSNITDSSTRTQRIGPGLAFFPRPHFEFSGAWTKVYSISNGTNQEADYAWLLTHYYF